MASNTDSYISGIILEEQSQLSLGDLSKTCSIHAEFIVELVEEGIIEPLDREAQQWRFRGIALKRVQTVLNLQRDLGVNLAGIALILDLMDELKTLRANLGERTSLNQ